MFIVNTQSRQHQRPSKKMTLLLRFRRKSRSSRCVSFSQHFNILKDKFLRSLAEAENLRQRTRTEVSLSVLLGAQYFRSSRLRNSEFRSLPRTLSPLRIFSRYKHGCLSILHVQMALEAVPVEERTNANNPHLVNLFDGLVGYAVFVVV